MSLWVDSQHGGVAVHAVSIRDVGPESWRPVELRHVLDALPGARECVWRVEIEELTGGLLTDEIAGATDQRHGIEPVVLDPEAMHRFAGGIDQSFGGLFVGFPPGTGVAEVDRALDSASCFAASPVRYVVRDIRGAEWIVLTKLVEDRNALRSRFKDVRDEDANREFMRSD